MLKIYIDEAGRWPLAWPLHVWLVLPIKRFIKKDFRDSKVLSEKMREKLFKKINQLEEKWAICSAIGTISAKEIDERKITKSINIAIQRALLIIFKKLFEQKINQQTMQCSCDVMDHLTIKNLLHNPLKTQKDLEEMKILTEKMKNFIGEFQLIIDGKHDFGLENDLNISTKTIVKWDQKEPCIAMGSILAKVSRDHFLVEKIDPEFPEYWFAQHKWYWTAFHRKQIENLWPCPYHRDLFLKKIEKNPKVIKP